MCHEITYDTVVKSCGVGGGGAGGESAPQKFWFAENLSKIPENPGIHPALFDFKTWHPKFAEKHMKAFFWRPHPKRCSWSLWEKDSRQNCTKNFSSKFGEIRAKFLRTPKICLLLHLWWKGTSASIAPFWKGSGGNAPAMPPSSGVPVYIILHSLYSLW